MRGWRRSSTAIPASGLFGYSHMYGGYPGGQAEYARVPFADVGPLKVPDTLTDEQVLFLSDIFPTGYMAAENCQIKPGDTVAVWGCGPVGQFAIKSAYLLGAERVIAIDRFAERLELASSQGGAETLNYEDVDVLDALRHMTGGQGPDACIDAVGLEAHGTTLDAWYDRAKTSMFLATDRPHALRQAISACRKGGTVSIPGVYGGWLDKFPLGAAFAKGLTLKMGQTHMHKYMPILLERIERGEIDPSFIITHRIGLEDAPAMYRTFRDKHDSCIKVVMKPGGRRPAQALPPSRRRDDMADDEEIHEQTIRNRDRCVVRHRTRIGRDLSPRRDSTSVTAAWPSLDQRLHGRRRLIAPVTGGHRCRRSGMRSRGEGRILLTGSIAGFMPVTCLMPGATETDFFERADMLDTKVGQGKKDDPADVARVGFDAMMRGDGDVVSGWQNKLQSAIANVTPAGILAEQHRRMAEPGSATKANE